MHRCPENFITFIQVQFIKYNTKPYKYILLCLGALTQILTTSNIFSPSILVVSTASLVVHIEIIIYHDF